MKNWNLNLDGEWNLIGTPAPGAQSTREIHTTARVPSSLEITLQEAGLIGDPFVGMNAKAVRPFEYYNWHYEREFALETIPASVELVLEGVDCLAEIFINGQSIGKTENALIAHRLPVTSYLRSGRNTIAIDLTSPSWKLHDMPLECGMLGSNSLNYEAQHFRKPAHSWGWDICPRLPLGGIFRSIYLEERPLCRIAEDRTQMLRQHPDGAIEVLYQYRIENQHRECTGMKLVLTGTCGDSKWHFEEAIWAPQGHLFMVLQDIKLWNPKGYGEPNLYDIHVELQQNGNRLAEHDFTTGFRIVELRQQKLASTTDEPAFQFAINQQPIRVRGYNHVPADALHSRDKERLPKILELLKDSGSNMVRMWGGSLYEDDSFFDFCDRNGILVWQDFMMACGTWPRYEAFKKNLADEATAVIKRLRHHPSLALWCGDNECDMTFYYMLIDDPDHNILTRQLLPELCSRHDPGRPYLMSSPWMTPESRQIHGQFPDNFMPEQHLWGARDYFKADFYRQTTASFSSEIGMPGCPGVSSLKRFLTDGHLEPDFEDQEWLYHCSNPYLPDNTLFNFRIKLLWKHIECYFGMTPKSLETFAKASQLYQAEAYKYLVECQRTTPKYSGILLWNLIDSWPLFSESVIDYYFNPKLAYYYIKRCYKPLLITLGEAVNWNREIIISNDGKAQDGELSIESLERGEILLKTQFTVNANSIKHMPGIPGDIGTKELLLLKWKTDDGTQGVNHFITGAPQYDFKTYCTRWLPAIAALDHSFAAEDVAK